MKRACVLLLAGACSAAPSNHNQAKYGSVSVSIDGDLSPLMPGDLSAMDMALVAMSNVGPDVVHASSGADVSITVYTLSQSAPDPDGTCVTAVARDPSSSGLTRDDRFCVAVTDPHRSQFLGRGTAYLIGRHLRMSPICLRANQAPLFHCSTQEIGAAVMNPPPIGIGEDPGPSSPTQLDIDEFRLGHP